MDALEIDVATLASLTAAGFNSLVLARLHGLGYRGIRVSHGYVFQRLVDESPTVTSLAESLGITQQGASKQVRELEDLGYVERRGRPGDLRVREVRLTERGRSALEAGRTIRSEIEADLLDRVGPRNATTTRKTLAVLLEIVGIDDKIRTRRMPLPPD